VYQKEKGVNPKKCDGILSKKNCHIVSLPITEALFTHISNDAPIDKENINNTFIKVLTFIILKKSKIKKIDETRNSSLDLYRTEINM
jgi:hypothetical protein